MDSLSLQYLEAMGIDVYRVRSDGEAEAEALSQPLIELSNGDGDILCIVGNADQARLKLAQGIGAAMRCSPVWAWPVTEDAGAGEVRPVHEAVTEKLFTRILVFGEALARQVVGERAPTVISAARVHVVPGLEQVGQDQQAKRALWKLMLDHGIAAPRDSGKPRK